MTYVSQKNTLKHEFLSKISKHILNYIQDIKLTGQLERTLYYSIFIYICLTLTFPLTKRKQLTVSTYCYIWQFINKIGTSNNIYHIMKMAYLCDMYVSSLCNLHNGLKPFSKVAFLHSYSCIFMKNINAQLIIC